MALADWGFSLPSPCLCKDSHPNILNVATTILVYKAIFMHVYMALDL